MIKEIFNKMDKWRHFPSYQLERRADIFFALYLEKIMSTHFKKKFCPEIFPEFPLNKSVVSNIKSNQTFKVDYVMFD